MHTYQLTSLTSLVDLTTLTIVEKMVEEGLDLNDNWDTYSDFIKRKVLSDLGREWRLVVVDMVGKSFVITIGRGGGKRILIRAQHRDLSSLEDLSAFCIARSLGKLRVRGGGVDRLELPTLLQTRVRKYLRCVVIKTRTRDNFLPRDFYHLATGFPCQRRVGG